LRGVGGFCYVAGDVDGGVLAVLDEADIDDAAVTGDH